ncbi:Uncharacterised protein [Salmonella enterica subsp. enterica serovar Bovismorbificans]|nr:Uncharacterised protein [Salmonella enterica subsp. enterica serovar Bovismorbificans]
MHTVEQVMTDDLAGNCLGFIVQEHHVVAIPAYRAADVQQQPWHIEHGGGNFVGNHFSGMEVARIQAQRGLTAGGVAHVELIGADGVAFRADAKQFALNGVDVVRRVEFLANDLIQRFQQALARG